MTHTSNRFVDHTHRTVRVKSPAFVKKRPRRRKRRAGQGCRTPAGTGSQGRQFEKGRYRAGGVCVERSGEMVSAGSGTAEKNVAAKLLNSQRYETAVQAPTLPVRVVQVGCKHDRTQVDEVSDDICRDDSSRMSVRRPEQGACTSPPNFSASSATL